MIPYQSFPHKTTTQVLVLDAMTDYAPGVNFSPTGVGDVYCLATTLVSSVFDLGFNLEYKKHIGKCFLVPKHYFDLKAIMIYAK